MDLPFRIPDALLPIIFGMVVWFGVCYIFIAPELTERALARHIIKECDVSGRRHLCNCIIDDIEAGGGAFMNAAFISSFTVSEPRIDLFGEERNPYVEYISLQIKNRERVQACKLEVAGSSIKVPATPMISVDEIEEKKVSIVKPVAITPVIPAVKVTPKQPSDTPTNVRIDFDDLKDTVSNSAVAGVVKDEVETAKEVLELKQRTDDFLLKLWRRGLNIGEQKLEELDRRYSQ